MMRCHTLHQHGKLAQRADSLLSKLARCSLCPRACGVDRTAGEHGFCGIGERARIASYSAHFGEETPLVGKGGSGTIFFSGCNLGCRFCQNHDISMHPENGVEATHEELAGVMLRLQEDGCENINVVTPSHVVPQIVAALVIAIEHGLDIPLVYNTSGYDSEETIELLDSVVDIYMPDVKLWDADLSERYLQAGDYPERARRVVPIMHKQVSDLVLDEAEMAVSGLLVRHLVLPKNIAGTAEWMKFIVAISTNTYINIMDQYHPCTDIQDFPEIGRMISDDEYQAALNAAEQVGLHRLDRRDSRFWARLLR